MSRFGRPWYDGILGCLAGVAVVAALGAILAFFARPDREPDEPEPPAEVAPAASPDVDPSPTLIDFYASWCGPCREMAPEVARAEARGVPIVRVDVDADPSSARRYGVASIPTVVVVDGGGNELARAVGYREAREIESLYRKARQAARPRRFFPRAATNPQPWETSVRIRVALDDRRFASGSGTVIKSDPSGAIVLTCAHLFCEGGRAPCPPSQFARPVSVDLFAGPPSGPEGRLRFEGETHRATVVDYDPTADLALIRLAPSTRPLPASRVVPARWSPRDTMRMVAVGCPGGADATAWPTLILRASVALRRTDTGRSFEAIECDRKPEQGRSGGGLFTEDGFVAGVCGYGDASGSGKGLYMHPTAIRAMLDKHGLAAVHSEAGAVVEPESAGRRPGRDRSQLPEGSASRVEAGAEEVIRAATGGPDLFHWLLGSGLVVAAATAIGVGLKARGARIASEIRATIVGEDDPDEEFRRLFNRYRVIKAARARKEAEDKELAAFREAFDKIGQPDAPAPTTAPPADAA